MSLTDHTTTEDEKVLHGMGYAQELSRRMGPFQSFAISFSIICIISGGLASFPIALSTAGPWAATIGWIIGGVYALIVAAALGQIASAYPTAGGLYHWSSILGGRFWGWLTAYFNLLGLLFVIPAVNVILYSFIRDLFFHGMLGWDVSGWDDATKYLNTQAYWVAGITIAQALLNHFGIKLTTMLTDFAGYLILAVSVLLILMFFWAAKSNLHFGQAFELVNKTGDAGGGVAPQFNSIWVAIAMAMLYPLFTITGFDASAHTSEETVNARNTVHKGMLHSVFWSLLFGFVLALSMVVALPALYAALAADPKQAVLTADQMGALAKIPGGPSAADMAVLGGNSFTALFNTLIMPTLLGKVLAIGIIIANFLCALAAVTSTSRMVYAFARDGGLPFSDQLSSVSPTFRTPVWAIWFTAVLTVILTIITTPLNAFVALSTGSAMYLYISYGMPIIAGLFAEGSSWTTFGPFRLGVFSRVFAVIVLIGTLLLLFAGHALVPSISAVAAVAADAKANPPVVGSPASPFIPGLWYYTVGYLVILGILWFAIENRRFAGPPIGAEAIAKRQDEIATAEAALAKG